ncbi:uncharacterized protein LOC119675009 isoform X2 [Teleopsis dalmanni]|uniref:uncharacterized protein LOC119675009 isoform X2 n=1 Tax=Teleopsis dalmanni TaxID=139649 RepID=UPI0018CD53ED|nr:uncharacterized protein LOC119675009 isoform X2 [Teleopsis dalmanni]
MPTECERSLAEQQQDSILTQTQQFIQQEQKDFCSDIMDGKESFNGEMSTSQTSTTSSNGHNGNTNGLGKKVAITSPDPTAYVAKARVTRPTPPPPSYNPMQFVQIKPCNLYQTAQQQLKKAEEVKKIKEIKKEEPEDWQNNLDNWKSSRRKRVEHIIDRVVEVKKLELEEHDRTRRKSKTFSEMIEERSDRPGRTRAKLTSLAVYNEDESNDFSDLGIGTSSASGKSSLSEDYDNNSVMSDNAELDKAIFENNHKLNSTTREYISSPGYDTSSSTAPASSPDPCEYTYEGAIQDYKQRVSRAISGTGVNYKLNSNNITKGISSASKESTPERGNNGLPETYPTRRGSKIEDRLIGFEVTSPSDSQEGVEKQKVDLPKIDISKRKEIFENQQNTNTEPKLLANAVGVPKVTLRDRFKVESNESVNNDIQGQVKKEVKRMSGDITSIRDRLQSLEQQQNIVNSTNGATKNVASKLVDIPVPPLKERLSSLQNAVTKEELKKPPVALVDARQLEIMKNEEETAKQRMKQLEISNCLTTITDAMSTKIVECPTISIQSDVEVDRDDSGIHTSDDIDGEERIAEQLKREQEQQLNDAIAALALEEKQLEEAANAVNQIEAEFAELTSNPSPLPSLGSVTNEQPCEMEFSINEALELALEAIDKETSSINNQIQKTNTNLIDKNDHVEEITADDVTNAAASNKRNHHNHNNSHNNNTNSNNIAASNPNETANKTDEEKELKSKLNKNIIDNNTNTNSNSNFDDYDNLHNNRLQDYQNAVEQHVAATAADNEIETIISQEPIYENVSATSMLELDVEANQIIPKSNITHINNKQLNININNNNNNEFIINNNNSNKTNNNNINNINNNNLVDLTNAFANTTITTTATATTTKINKIDATTFKEITTKTTTTVLKTVGDDEQQQLQQVQQQQTTIEQLQQQQQQTSIEQHNNNPKILDPSNNTPEPYYQVPKSIEPYYDAPKHLRPVPVYENIEVFYTGLENSSLATSSNDVGFKMEPPKEKPPPPPTESPPLFDEIDCADNTSWSLDNTYETISSRLPMNGLAVEHPSPPIKRMNSTKRIKKELRNKRSSFLGIEGSLDDDETYLELTVAPPPDMAQLLQEERRLEKQLYLKAGLCDSSDTGESRDSGVSENHSRQSSEHYTNSSEENDRQIDSPHSLKQNEVIYQNETLLAVAQTPLLQTAKGNSAESWTESATAAAAATKSLTEATATANAKMLSIEEKIREQEEVLRVERELLQLEQEELKRQRENLVLRENMARRELQHGAKMLLSANRHSLQDLNGVGLSISVPTNGSAFQPTIIPHTLNQQQQQQLQATQLTQQQQQQQQIYANVPNLQQQYYQVETDYRKSMSDLNEFSKRLMLPPMPPTKPMRAVHVATNGYDDFVRQRHSLNTQSYGGSLVKIATPTAAPRGQIYTNYQHQSAQNLANLNNANQNNQNFNASTNGHVHHSNMSRNTLHALSATPKPKYTDGWVQVQNRKSYDSNLANDPAWLSAYQQKRKSMPDAYHAYNNHWLIQEAEQRRVAEQQQRRAVPTSNTTSLQQHNGSTKGTSNNNNGKPLPDSIIQSLTERVQSKGIGERKRLEIYNSNNIDKTSLHAASYQQQQQHHKIHQQQQYKTTATHRITSDVNSTTQMQVTTNTSTTSQPTNSTQDKVLSVSGKKKCSHCGDELGKLCYYVGYLGCTNNKCRNVQKAVKYIVWV